MEYTLKETFHLYNEYILEKFWDKIYKEDLEVLNRTTPFSNMHVNKKGKKYEADLIVDEIRDKLE